MKAERKYQHLTTEQWQQIGREYSAVADDMVIGFFDGSWGIATLGRDGAVFFKIACFQAESLLRKRLGSLCSMCPIEEQCRSDIEAAEEQMWVSRAPECE